MARRRKKIKSENDVSLDHHLKHLNWCINNDVIIYFEPIDWRTGRIVLEDKGIKSKSERIYVHHKPRVNDKDHNKAMYKLATKMYKKYNNGKI